MGKKTVSAGTNERPRKKSGPKAALILAGAVVTVLIAAVLLFPRLKAPAAEPTPTEGPAELTGSFTERSAALREYVLGPDGSGDCGAVNVPGAGYVAFLSVSNGEARASVFCGVGETPGAAWDAAEKKGREYTDTMGYEVKWLKADLISQVRLVSPEELSALMDADKDGYFRRGVSLDRKYTQALLESELNGCGIYDYEARSLNLDALNARLRVRGDKPAEALPERLRIFYTVGFFMDEDGAVCELTGGDECAVERRIVERVDEKLVLSLAKNASQYILPHVNENGAFNYGVYPSTGEQIEGYSSLLHASATWMLELLYKTSGDESLLPAIGSAVRHLLSYVLLAEDGAAYLYEPQWSEIKTGGAGVAIVALTEYMDLTGDEKYLDVTKALGDGLITMQDQKTGRFCHIVDLYLAPVQQMAERYYDGAAVFGLCRLYGVDGDPKWLAAAQKGMDYMINQNYAQYADQWASYAVNALTKYRSDERYYAFGFENAMRNLEKIKASEGASPEYLELLMNAFELYERAKKDRLPIPESFDLPVLLEAIYQRANRMLDGYFFPESAMYMASPGMIVDTFMVIRDGVCRVRIDDVQHNVCAYYLYYKNYADLIAAGMKAA